MTDALAVAADELYAAPPDGFIAARNAIVERLKADGDADAAAEVAKLRKPSVAAWAVDRLARGHPDDIGALIAAGRELASAQRKMSAGGDADAMREASDERRRLVDHLVRAAGTILAAAGLSAARATLDKVSDTLLAIATDEDAAERVQRGVLDKELPAPAGFGDERLDAAPEGRDGPQASGRRHPVTNEPLAIHLEPWGPGDLPLLERLLGDPAMMEHLGGPESPEQLAERQARYERLPEPDRMFKVVDDVTGEGIGQVGYWERTVTDEVIWETGWFVLPAFQGRGIASAATALAIEHAWTDGRHRFMHAYPAVDNPPSNAICRKLGFSLLEAIDFEYPAKSGHMLRCNDWRLDLATSP